MVNNALRYREWDLFQNTLQTFPKQLPPKTKTQESSLKAMISMDKKGFGLYPLVLKKNPQLGRVFNILFNSNAE